MATFINHVTIAAPRNGTASHTVDPSSGVAVAGTPFTPTAGNLLVCIAGGSVTSTTPAGWTLPTGGSAVNNSGLYLWYRVAAGDDTWTTDHNGPNFPVVFDIYEFPADSTLLGSAATANVSATGGAGPSLSGLTDSSNFRAAVGCQGFSSGPSPTYTWSNGTEAVDTFVAWAAEAGYGYSLSYVEDQVDATYSSAATSTLTFGGVERLVFAVNSFDAGETFPVSGSGEIVSDGSGSVTAILSASGSGEIVSSGSGVATAIMPVSGSGEITSDGGGIASAVLPVSGSGAVVSAGGGSARLYSAEETDLPARFPPIERVARAFIRQRYPAIGSRVGGDAQYALGQEPYVQVQQMPGGGADQLRGEWAVDIAVFDDNFLRAVEIANDLEALFVSTKGARHEGMIVDSISQNQTPSKRPTKDKRIFEVGTIYVFEARRPS